MTGDPYNTLGFTDDTYDAELADRLGAILRDVLREVDALPGKPQISRTLMDNARLTLREVGIEI